VLVERARRAVLEFFHADDEYTAIFTPNASGALKHVGECYPFEPGGRLLLTTDNHNSVNGIREFAQGNGASVEYAPLTVPELRVDAGRLDALLSAADPRRANLFAYPAQSNFSGVQHPLDLIERAHAKGWNVLLDAAAFVPSNRLDLRMARPDFVSISFYKMFGYPTGVGCLLARTAALDRLHRPWFAGGTVNFATVHGRAHLLSRGEAGFEDGTLDFLAIPAVELGLRHLDAAGLDRIHTRVRCLTAWLLERLVELRHSNGRPMVRIYGPVTTHLRGGIVTMNLYDPAGHLLDYRRVEELAGERSISRGFYSTRDADSEGEEGKFYVWSREELQSLLTDDEYALVAAHYGVDADANFEGHWHLTVHEPLQQIAGETASTVARLSERLARTRKKLLEARAGRIWPGRDEKQLTSWNALAIRGFAITGRVLDRPDLNHAASRAVDFLRENLVVDGRLYASYKDERTRFPAYLDDHAFLLDALLEMLQSDWQTQHLQFAIEIADLLLAHFHDNDQGGFFFTADDHEVLIDRPKPLADEALPSGNGIAAFALQRLGFLLGESRYLDAAEKTLRAASQAMEEYPHGHVSLITALEEYLAHPEIIVIRGDADETRRWRDSAAKLYAPRRLVFAIDRDAADLPGALADRRPVDGETVAYRCVGNHCSLPISGFEALAAELRDG
jgi:selenocysteine lyase/cysteine desulfurase